MGRYFPSMDPFRTIFDLVNAVLPRGSGDLSLLVNLEASVRVKAYDLEFDEYEYPEERLNFQLLFHRPQNYTSVFLQTDQGGDFVLLSHHDSAWREDGVENACKRMVDAAVNSLKRFTDENNYEIISGGWNDARYELNFCRFGKAFEFYNVEVEPCDKNRKRVVSINRVDNSLKNVVCFFS